jgi:hypothetical protein
MAERRVDVKCGRGHSAGGVIWFIGWLFSIGYLHLHFWKAVLGLIIWPYYLGVAVAPKVIG